MPPLQPGGGGSYVPPPGGGGSYVGCSGKDGLLGLPFYPFLGEGSPTKIGYRKRVPLF